MENISNLAKAVIAVMKSIKGIDKNMTIGSGNNSYKGVSDKEVKNIIGKEMEANGLCILPIATNAKTQIDRWEAPGYNGGANVQKQQVFTEVETRYLLLHESGESIELSGYGHGVDSQDKSAGKATTYALKYTLLYTFMIATGKIDDADNEHSDTKEPPSIKNNFVQEVKNAVSKLDNCFTVEELKMFKSTLESYVITNPEFQKAAKKRFETISQPAKV